MKKIQLTFLIFIFLSTFSSAEDNFVKKRIYDFNIYDGTLNSYTTHQMNQNYLSINRIINREIEGLCSGKEICSIPISMMINCIWPSFTYAITHEEGHRSILTAKGIGSISQPFFNSRRTAYVKGVTDQLLIDLRDNDRPTFVRMYTAGIEADYSMSLSEEKMIFWGNEKSSILYPDYLFRKISIISYLQLSTMFEGAERGYPIYKWLCDILYNLNEEDEELNRDIAGFDTFGATKALFMDANFHRYNNYSDFSEEEKTFMIKRVALRSYLNLLSPYLYIPEKSFFSINERIKCSFSMNYIMVPFGDFIEENLYFQYISLLFGKLNFSCYVRQQENYNTWFPAFGFQVIDFSPKEWITISAGIHFWFQPKNLDFYASESFFGGAFELNTRFMLPSNSLKNLTPSIFDSLGINIGVIYKTDGYMPEIEQHMNFLKLNLGCSFRY